MAPGLAGSRCIEVSSTRSVGGVAWGPFPPPPASRPGGTDPFQIHLLAPSPLAFHGSPEMCDLALNEGPVCAGAERPVKRTVQSPVARSPSCLVSQTGWARRSRDVWRPLRYFLFLNSAHLRQEGPRALLPFRIVTSASLSCVRLRAGMRPASTCLPGPRDRPLATWNCHSGTGCRRGPEAILEKQHRSSSTRFYHKSTSDANHLRVSQLAWPGAVGTVWFPEW